jgi:ABC-type glutathione transport system ATPase component
MSHVATPETPTEATTGQTPRTATATKEDNVSAQPLLRLEDVSVSIGSKVLVENVDWQVMPGQAVGLVGESGSGKSVTLRSVLGLLPSTAKTTGRILFEGEDVLRFSKRRRSDWWGDEVASVFQDPRTHVNPVHTIGDFLTEALRLRRRVSRRQAEDTAVEWLENVRIPRARAVLGQLPGELSGGMLQRVTIAAAMMTGPKLLFADEITTALDVTTQEEVMAILDEIRHELGLAMVFVTHDLDLAGAVCSELVVMRHGHIVEKIASEDVYDHAKDEYTQMLISARSAFTEVEETGEMPDDDGLGEPESVASALKMVDGGDATLAVLEQERAGAEGATGAATQASDAAESARGVGHNNDEEA